MTTRCWLCGLEGEQPQSDEENTVRVAFVFGLPSQITDAPLGGRLALSAVRPPRLRVRVPGVPVSGALDDPRCGVFPHFDRCCSSWRHREGSCPDAGFPRKRLVRPLHRRGREGPAPVARPETLGRTGAVTFGPLPGRARLDAVSRPAPVIPAAMRDHM